MEKGHHPELWKSQGMEHCQKSSSLIPASPSSNRDPGDQRKFPFSGIGWQERVQSSSTSPRPLTRAWAVGGYSMEQGESCTSPASLQAPDFHLGETTNRLSPEERAVLSKTRSIEELLEKYAPSPSSPKPLSPRRRKAWKEEQARERFRYTLAYAGAVLGAAPVLSPCESLSPEPLNHEVSPPSTPFSDLACLPGPSYSPQNLPSARFSASFSEGSHYPISLPDLEAEVQNLSLQDEYLMPARRLRSAGSSPTNWDCSIAGSYKSTPKLLSETLSGAHESDIQLNCIMPPHVTNLPNDSPVRSRTKSMNSPRSSNGNGLLYKSSSATNLHYVGVDTVLKPTVTHGNGNGCELSKLAVGSLDTARDQYRNLEDMGTQEVANSDITSIGYNSQHSMESNVSDSVSEMTSVSQIRSLNPLDSVTEKDTPDVHDYLLKPGDSVVGGTSRKSSTSDSAVDLRPPLSDDDQSEVSPQNSTHGEIACGKENALDKQENQDSQTFKPISDSVKIITRSDTTESRDSAGSNDRPRSPRMPFCKVQTPSFTQIIHPPSVIISDHSHDSLNSSNGSNLPHPSHTNHKEDVGKLPESNNGLAPKLERKLSSSSISSDRSDHSDSVRSMFSDSSYSQEFDEDELDFNPFEKPKLTAPQSSWRKIRNIVHWSPFIQQFRKHKYPWVQLAGHQGNFCAGDSGTILKKLCPKEHKCLQKLMTDILRPYVPEYKGDVERNGEKYVQMQDLLCEFESPCVMDCKIGVRTYLEDELEKARQNPKLRKDMYQKMIEIDPNEPTEEERAAEGITKPRYMQWRETMSSTSTVGFRIEGIKKQESHRTDFKTTKTIEQVKEALKSFTGDNKVIQSKYLRRLQAIRATLETSPFFASHEVIGSSLLFVHDSSGKACVWMIDFGKTTLLPEGKTLDHRSTWIEGNHEDGYFFGMDNMITIFKDLSEEDAS